MQVREHATTSTMPFLIANVLGVLAALVVLAVLTNTIRLVDAGDATALIALVLLGVGMCALAGISRAPAKLGWTHPVTLSGVVLGVAILALIAANALGGIGVLESFATALGTSVERAEVLFLAVLMAVKWVIGLAFVR